VPSPWDLLKKQDPHRINPKIKKVHGNIPTLGYSTKKKKVKRTATKRFLAMSPLNPPLTNTPNGNSLKTTNIYIFFFVLFMKNVLREGGDGWVNSIMIVWCFEAKGGMRLVRE
jgi:hypothetical protein